MILRGGVCHELMDNKTDLGVTHLAFCYEWPIVIYLHCLLNYNQYNTMPLLVLSSKVFFISFNALANMNQQWAIAFQHLFIFVHVTDTCVTSVLTLLVKRSFGVIIE